jgi:LAO/AO transport system ATPase
MFDSLLEAVGRGDRRALSRLLTRVARGQAGDDLLAGLPPAAKTARVVAVTGSGGVGKSTLIGKLIEHLRGQGQAVAVLACDPRSPVSGGALLGDRFRMTSRPDDDGVFIRSLAAAGGEGAVARHLPAMIRLLEVYGFDVILIETVGAGQADTAVHDLADVVVLLLQPETGDDLQWEKAGLLEVADVVVIHKADLSGAEAVEAQVRSSLNLPGAPEVPVLRVSAKDGLGIGALWQAVEACALRRSREDTAGQNLLRLAVETLGARFAAALDTQDAGLRQLIADWQKGTLNRSAAVDALLHHLGNADGIRP